MIELFNGFTFLSIVAICLTWYSVVRIKYKREVMIEALKHNKIESLEELEFM